MPRRLFYFALMPFVLAVARLVAQTRNAAPPPAAGRAGFPERFDWQHKSQEVGMIGNGSPKRSRCRSSREPGGQGSQIALATSFGAANRSTMVP